MNVMYGRDGCAGSAGINGCPKHAPRNTANLVPTPVPLPGPFWCPDCGTWWAGFSHRCRQSAKRAEEPEHG